MQGTERFGKLTAEVTLRLHQEVPIESMQDLINTLLIERNESAETPRLPEHLAPFYELVVGGFHEIEEALQYMRDAALLLSRSSSHPEVAAQRYLRFHIEAYLHGLYVFYERIKSYLTRIARLYRRSERAAGLDQLCASLRDETLRVLEPLMRERGDHVHRAPFERPDLGRVRLWEELSYLDKPTFNAAYARQILLATTHWTKILRETNDDMAKLLDVLCNALLPFLFSEDGVACLPAES